MEVKLIGTGGIFSPFNSACALINKHILVDIPNGSLKEMRKNNINIKDIDCIFVTHLHGDHYFDIPFLLLEKYKLDKKNIKIIGSSDTETKVRELTKIAFPDSYEKIFSNLKVEFLLNDTELKIDKIKVNSLKMNHRETEAYGYIFQDNEEKIGFTGDTALCESVYKMMNECKKVVADTTFEIGTDTHMGVNDILMLLKKYPNTTIIPTHTSPREKRILSFQSFDNLLLLNDMDDIK